MNSILRYVLVATGFLIGLAAVRDTGSIVAYAIVAFPLCWIINQWNDYRERYGAL